MVFLSQIALKFARILSKIKGFIEFVRYDVVWMEWPQVQKGWTPDELNYISNINPKADVELLSKHFKFRDVTIKTFIFADYFLFRSA